MVWLTLFPNEDRLSLYKYIKQITVDLLQIMHNVQLIKLQKYCENRHRYVWNDPYAH